MFSISMNIFQGLPCGCVKTSTNHTADSASSNASFNPLSSSYPEYCYTPAPGGLPVPLSQGSAPSYTNSTEIYNLNTQSNSRAEGYIGTSRGFGLGGVGGEGKCGSPSSGYGIGGETCSGYGGGEPCGCSDNIANGIIDSGVERNT